MVPLPLTAIAPLSPQPSLSSASCFRSLPTAGSSHSPPISPANCALSQPPVALRDPSKIPAASAPLPHISPPPSTTAPPAIQSAALFHWPPPPPPTKFSTLPHPSLHDSKPSPAPNASPIPPPRPVSAQSPAVQSLRHIFLGPIAPSPGPQTLARHVGQPASPSPAPPAPAPTSVASNTALPARTTRPDGPGPAASLRSHTSPHSPVYPRPAPATLSPAPPSLSAPA